MAGAVDRAKRFYGRDLEPGERIDAVRNATAAGTGSSVLTGMLVGALAGWLVAVNTDTPLLPAIVFGAFTGELGGYLLARRRARRADGPGAVQLQLVLTDRRLFTVRRYAATRRRVLRSYPLHEVTLESAGSYPIGRYHRLDITPAEGPTTSLVVEGNLDLP